MNLNLEKFSAHVYDWLLLYGPRILLAAVVLITGQWLIRLLRAWITKALHRRNFDNSLKPFLLSLAVTVCQILLVLGAMQIIGVQMTVFAALIGGIGVAFGLALSGSLQNFTGGILVLILRPYRVGDTIIAQNLEGTVTSIEIFYTEVTTFDNKTVIIPNSKLSNEVIINLSRLGKRRLDIELTFPYSADFQSIKEVLEKAVGGSKELLNDPPVRIGISQFNAEDYVVLLSVWVKAHGFIDTQLSLQNRIMEELRLTDIKFQGM